MSVVAWHQVERRAEKILILATGPSVEKYDADVIPDDVYVIAVKEAIDFAGRADAWITVDVNPRALLRMRERVQGVDYYAAVPDNFGSKDAALWYHRELIHGINYLRRVSFGKRRNDIGLSDDARSLHSGNSAFGALGLAYHMRPRRVVMLGVDATQQAYGKGVGRPNSSLQHLPELFRSTRVQLAKRNIQVVNSDKSGRITCFERKPWRNALDWLVG